MRDKPIKVAVVGIGGIGGILTSLFSKNGFETYAVTSRDSSNMINESGLNVSSTFFGTFKSHPIATERLDTVVDLIIFATKSPYLRESFNRINPATVGKPLYLSLLNGLGSRELVIEKFGKRFLTGSIGSIEVYRDEDGIINHSTNQSPVINLSKEDSVSKVCLEETINLFESAGIKTNKFSNYHEVIWDKLVRLGAIASSTAAFQMSVGEIIENEDKKEILFALIEEGSLIANNLGVIINSEQVKRQVEELPYNLMTSLSRDINIGRPSELNSITIAIAKKGKELNIDTPAYDHILRLIKKKNEN